MLIFYLHISSNNQACGDGISYNYYLHVKDGTTSVTNLVWSTVNSHGVVGPHDNSLPDPSVEITWEWYTSDIVKFDIEYTFGWFHAEDVDVEYAVDIASLVEITPGNSTLYFSMW
jgi:hypothetical protein